MTLNLQVKGKKAQIPSLFPQSKEAEQGLGTKQTRVGSPNSLIVSLDGTGDYEDIQVAINNLPTGGGNIFIKEGTYKIKADIIINSANVKISGAGTSTVIQPIASSITDTIFFFKANNCTLENLKIDGANDSSGNGLYVDGHSNILLRNLTITTTLGCYLAMSDSIMKDCSITASSDAGMFLEGDDTRIENVTITTAIDTGIYCESGHYRNIIKSCKISGLSGTNADGIEILENNNFIIANCVIGGKGTGADIKIGGTSPVGHIIQGNILLGTGNYGLYIDNAENCMITGNVIDSPSLDGVRLLSLCNYNVISGNSLTNCAIVADASAVANVVTNNTKAGFVTEDEDSAIGNIFMNSAEGFPATETKSLYLDNGSGAQVGVGAVVVYGTHADGKEFSTTTAQGDDRVVGVLEETTSNGSAGFVKVIGKTTLLKVDGTADIAIGDFLGTFTTVEIAMKADAGDMVFAIALEAYTTNDSNGVINALIITPRKI